MTSVAAAALSPDVVRPARRRGYSTAWWGMMILITTEAMVFLILLAAYFFLRASSPRWPPAGVELPNLSFSIPFSFVLWGSSAPIFWVDAVIGKGQMGKVKTGLLISFLMGLSFVGYTISDFNGLHFGWRDNAYSSAFYTIVGLHLLHVIIGLFINLVVQLKVWGGKISAARHITVDVFSLYWHFVDAVWLFVWPSLFLSPHIR
jgi:heme/copper-type cytochrome/quinol oxidase subunit 3